MTTLYLDAFSGASGDMLVAACADLGFPITELDSLARALELAPDALSVRRVMRGPLSCSKFDVRLDDDHHEHDHHHHHRHLEDLERIVDALPYSDAVKARAVSVLRNLARAEAKIHGIAVDEVHFHEVGAADSLIDIVGFCQALEKLGVTRLVSSPLPTGRGFVECAHGMLPLPAPAALELLRGVPTYPSGRDAELVTPTAAALISTIAEGFGALPPGIIAKIGYGAGSRVDESGPPNALRVMLVEEAAETEKEGTIVLETNIDDMNPQLYPVLTEKLLEAGALDVALLPCTMKKGRPGTLARIIGRPETLEKLSEVLFRESTSIGLRWWPVSRIVGRRSIESIQTEYGSVRVKITRMKGRIVNVTPEFEDCRAAAEKQGVPVKTILQSAVSAALSALRAG